MTRCVVLLFAGILAFGNSPALAAKKDSKRSGDPVAAIKKKLDGIDLTDEAKASVKKVLADHAAKLKDAQANVAAVLTDEQKSAQRSARKDAKSAGKSRKEAKADLEAALKLTPEQKEKLTAAEKELAAAQKSLQEDLRKVLTPEQLAKAGIKTKKKSKA